jgi:hypothetical protein
MLQNTQSSTATTRRLAQLHERLGTRYRRWRGPRTPPGVLRLGCGVLATPRAACSAAGCTGPMRFAPERLPRFVAANGGAPPTVALVLGSGGPRGFAHIGVLKVLDETASTPTSWWARAWARWWGRSMPTA